jgi:serine/threonine protein phosphatase PrpC
MKLDVQLESDSGSCVRLRAADLSVAGANHLVLGREDEDTSAMACGPETAQGTQILTPWALFVVADGLGGRSVGKTASSIAANVAINETGLLLESGLPRDIGDATFLLVSVLRKVVQAFDTHVAGEPSHRDMATTIAIVLVTKHGDVFVCHLGDTRVYLFRPGEGLVRLTEVDHNCAEDTLYTGAERQAIARTRGREHSPATVATRMITAGREYRPDFLQTKLQKGDRLFIGTDGAYSKLNNPGVIEGLLTSSDDPEKIAQAIVRAAQAAWSRDDLTANVFLAT